MIKDIQEALAFLPQHRKRAGKRAENIHLDALIDERRTQEELRHGVYDFVMMSYRYRALALREIRKFLGPKKKLKPSEMEDLLCLGFGALLSRDKTPGPVIVDALVESAKKTWGQHCSGLFNAFFRQVLRNKKQLQNESQTSPEVMLPSHLRERWKNSPELINFVGKNIAGRPSKGVSGFGRSLEHKTQSLELWRSEEVFQAMDRGSWELCNWIWMNTQSDNSTDKGPFRLLDACSAPGGKLVCLSQMILNSNQSLDALATDANFARLETLKQNLDRWSLQEVVKPQLKVWGDSNGADEAINNQNWSLVLADLPCSGTGTVFSRPDVLLKNFVDEEKSLFELQEKILTEVSTLRFKRLCVSLCSVDPSEIEHVEKIIQKVFDVKVSQFFHSWNEELNAGLNDSPSLSAEENLREGLVGWWIEP